jgi:hypothetical protein
MKRTLLLVWAATLAAGCHQPPADMMMHPGPGVGGPGPGVMQMGAAPMRQFISTESQVFFTGPDGMEVAWESGGPGNFSPPMVIAAGRYNFPQGSLYRLKLTGIPDRVGLELYPTMEIAPANPKTDAYLSHSPIPIGLSQEDIDQILAGNYVTKVVYLPDPEHQELAIAGVETLVSTRLEPGVDPILEADRRGSILAILRVGNIDLEMPGTEVTAMGPQGPIVRAGGAMTAAMPAGYMAPGPASGAAPYAMASGVGGSPSWGIPISGTPIGLPGPPHVPLGGPAGLKKHTITNRTLVSVPGPTEKFDVTVKHWPGIRVPRPVRRVNITEQNGHLHLPF